jgi:putative transposase
MPRPAPIEYGAYYHLYNRGNGGENIFREPSNYAYFLMLYARHVEPIADMFAYCLLRNHFHLLIRIKEEQHIMVDEFSKHRRPPSPPQQFSNFFNSYAKGFNKTYQRTGSLFQRPFGRVRVSTDAYLINLVHYIHFNPQKHGFVNDFREYPYSSYQTICSDMPTKLQRDRVLEWFDGRQSFERFHREHADEKTIAKLIGDDFD